MQQWLKAAQDPRDPTHWDPPFCGDIDMEIQRDGRWFYQGSPIHRVELCRLFARILRKEAEQYFLVTPVEKVRIRVEDLPFVIVAADWHQQEGHWLLRDNLDHSAILDKEHALFNAGDDQHPRFVVHWRSAMLARLHTSVYYQLIETLVEKPGEGFGINSAGHFFLLGKSVE